MIFLYIYIGTILFFYLGFMCCFLDLKKRISKDVLKKLKSKENWFSTITKVFIMSVIPVLNFFIGWTMLFSEELRKKVETTMYKRIEEQKGG